MRLYAFVNMYLSGIQKGIQTSHMLQEMNLKYGTHTELKKWAEWHKTVIVLEGGNCANLNVLLELFRESAFLTADFREDTESLNGAITCVGILLPEWAVEATQNIKTTFDISWTENTLKVFEAVGNARLASN